MGKIRGTISYKGEDIGYRYSEDIDYYSYYDLLTFSIEPITKQEAYEIFKILCNLHDDIKNHIKEILIYNTQQSNYNDQVIVSPHDLGCHSVGMNNPHKLIIKISINNEIVN